MQAFIDAATVSLDGVTGGMFALGAVIVGISAAGFLIWKLSSMAGGKRG